MKIENIKTITEFYEFADIWHQRSHRLREVWQNIINTDEQRAKAFTLWLIMYDRVMKLFAIATRTNQVKPPKFENCNLHIVGNSEVACCGNCHLPLDNIEMVKKVQIADKKYNP